MATPDGSRVMTPAPAFTDRLVPPCRMALLPALMWMALPDSITWATDLQVQIIACGDGEVLSHVVVLVGADGAVVIFACFFSKLSAYGQVLVAVGM